MVFKFNCFPWSSFPTDNGVPYAAVVAEPGHGAPTVVPSASAGLRIIFLDIDGVICMNDMSVLERPQLGLLQTVVRATGAKVVLSTNWRLYSGVLRRTPTLTLTPNLTLTLYLPSSEVTADHRPLFIRNRDDWQHA